jgi:hypothetical protein
VSSQNIISGDLKIKNLNGVLKATDGIVGISEPVMYFLGFWNANTNTPYLHNGTGVAGDVYKCNYAGIVNFGNGNIAFNAGDLVLYDGFVWDKVSSSGSGGGTSARNVYNFTATAGQTVFYLPYTPNQVDVYYNGSRLNQSLYIADNGAYVTLLFSPLAGDILTFNAYTVGIGVIARNVYNFTATNGQVLYTFNYIPNQLDVYYNGSRVTQNLYDANSGTSVTLYFLPIAGDILTFNAYISTAGVTGGGTAGSLAKWSNTSVLTDAIAGTDYVTPSQLSSYVPNSRTLTINGVTYDLSANRTWTIPADISSVVGTLPISVNTVSGAATVSISQSTTSTNGYLSSTDWNTFNNKQNALGYTPENVANKSTSTTLGTSNTLYPTQNAVKVYVDSAVSGGIVLQGSWNADLNIPDITGTTTTGWAWIVSVAGSTNLGGITDWQVGDIAVKSATGWIKIDNTDQVLSVFGRYGAVVAQTGDYTTTQVTEGTNLYYLDSRARAALSFVAGSGAYNSTTGVITIPTNNNQITNGSNFITLASLSATTPLFYNNATGVFTIQQSSASQSGYLSSTDWTTFNSKQGTITLTTTGSSGSSTFISNVLNIPTYTLSGLGGVPTSRQLTINGTAYDLSADRTWSVGTVTSVNLTMPSAFTVSSSPITSSGTIAVTGAGTTSQYIRGDGSLATYNPGTGGGGASQVFYFNGGVASSVTGYEQMSTTANTGASADFSRSSNGYIASFLTDSGSPNQLFIPAGNWNFEIYMQSSSSGGSPYFYVELYKYDGSAFTLISSSSTNPEYITNGTTIDLYTTALTVPSTTLLATDRLAVRVYVVTAGRTITMHTQDSNLSEVITTFTTGITALNGLTTQVQYFAIGTSGSDFNISSVIDTHTFNLPTASATNRGALSSADWTTFNNKQSALTNPVTGTGTTNTLPKFTDTSTIGNSNITDDGSLITLGSNSYVNGSLGVGTSSLTGFNLRLDKNITGATTSFNVSSVGQIQSDVTASAYSYRSSLSTQAASFTLTNLQHYYAQQGTIGSGSTVTNQYGFNAASSLVGATNNYGFYGAIPAQTNAWNLYMVGTANNYMAGSLGIGTTTLTGYNLNINKNITGALSSFGINNTGAIQSDVTTAVRMYSSSPSTQATTFTLGSLQHYTVGTTTIGSGSTITNQFGFVVLATAIGATNNYGFSGQLAAATNTWNLYMSGTANNYMAGSLGIGSTTLTGYNFRVAKTLTGATTAIAVYQSGQVQSDVTSATYGFYNEVNTQATAFTLTSYYHYAAAQGTIGASSAITTQTGFYVPSTLTGATNNYGFRGVIASGTGRWNLYMDGTATNFLQGELQLGSGQVVSASVLSTVTNKVKLIINGTTYYLLASTSGT